MVKYKYKFVFEHSLSSTDRKTDISINTKHKIICYAHSCTFSINSGLQVRISKVKVNKCYYNRGVRDLFSKLLYLYQTLNDRTQMLTIIITNLWMK